MRRSAWILTAVVVTGAASANGLAVRRYRRASGCVVPFVPNNVTVVREDLAVEIPEVTPRPGGPRWPYPWPRPARIRAEYVLRNEGAEAMRLPIRFPAMGVAGVGEPSRLHGRYEAPAPAAKFDAQPLAVSVQRLRDSMVYPKGHKDGPSDPNVRWQDVYDALLADEAKRYVKLCCLDALFLNPRTHELYSAWDSHPRFERNPLAYLPPYYLGFYITLRPGRTHRLVVQYWQHLGRHEPHSYQLTYIMKTARYWEKWLETHITVRIPRYRCDYIAIDPWPYEHRTTSRQHIYYITCGRPTRNLHVAIDPVGDVPLSGI